MTLGLAGRLARTFIRSPLTPLLLLAALALGVLALAQLAREEEPQISVPMVDVHVRADGLDARDAVELVTKPLEDLLKGIDGVEHVYSDTRDHGALVTARFFVGTDADDAILRVHEELRANIDRIPEGIPEPLVIGRGINDVPILTLTLSPRPDALERWDDTALFTLARQLRHELTKVENAGFSMIVGGREDEIRVEPDPELLSLHGVSLEALVEKVRHANRAFAAGSLRELNAALPVTAGETLRGVPDIGNLLLTTRDRRPVYVKDVAHVAIAGAPDEHRVWHLVRGQEGGFEARPAVSLALAKRTGSNAVDVTEAMLARIEALEGRLIPETVEVTVSRDYGKTAEEKSRELLLHLLGATVSIVVIIGLSVGWREGLVVMVVIPATILLTFFAAWMMGYTINRVSLFALIFSIGILVDDAIVMVENVVRRWQEEPEGEPMETAVAAVDEVGNPTIIATLTIIAALLPMLAVSGMMGPYMSPIPANASAAMLFSFFVAVTVAPWLLLLLRRRVGRRRPGGPAESTGAPGGRLGSAYLWVARPILRSRGRASAFLLVTALATLSVLVLFWSRDVTVKLLPFDNKSELQVVVDLPEGASLEQTERTLIAVAERLAAVPEIIDMQLHAGTAAPFNFNGLVRHYYLRDAPHQGDLAIRLEEKGARQRQSHAIALEVRERLAGLALPEGTALTVAEVPPGPPVIATLLAEVYGRDAATRREAARRIAAAYRAVPFIVDVDTSFGRTQDRLRLTIDEENLEYHGVEQAAVFDTIQTLLRGVRVGYSHHVDGLTPPAIVIRLPKADLFLSERLLSTPVPARDGTVELADVVIQAREATSYPIFRRNGHDAEMVMGELAGAFEAPVYGMLAVEGEIAAMDWSDLGGPPEIRYQGQPRAPETLALLWDGEWEITLTTFRDLGLAFAAALLAIYLLVVGQFSSFKLPLVILTPVPLTLIGIVLGHWAFAAPFSAPSMIGFIALAGIIVRNSILLVDFIRMRQAEGHALRPALLLAGAVRFRPIFLTAFTAMVGAAFILLDPIFQGLAISLLFGLLSATLLTVLVIPALYVMLRDDGSSFEGDRAPRPAAP